MSLKSESGRSSIGAKCVIDRVVLIPHGKLGADPNVVILWKVFWHPSREAVRISVIASLRHILRAVQVTMEIPCQTTISRVRK